MPERDAIAMWGSRLRWRLRGAWLWPTFAATTVADAVILAQLPFAGDRGNLLGSFLAAGFLNLAIVAVVARAGGALLRRRRPGLIREVAADRAGTLGLLALTALLVAGGIAHRPTLQASDDARSAAIGAARRFAAHRAPQRYLVNLHRSSTWQQGPSLYRTCFPGPDPRRDFCVFVRTDEPVPVVRRDPDQRPNATVAGREDVDRAGR